MQRLLTGTYTPRQVPIIIDIGDIILSGVDGYDYCGTFIPGTVKRDPFVCLLVILSMGRKKKSAVVSNFVGIFLCKC